MKRRILSIIIMLLALTSVSSSALESSKTLVLGVSPVLIDQAIKAKELIFRRQYDEALKLFGALAEEYPSSPTGLAGQMAVWQVRMFESDDFRYEKEFLKAEEKYEGFATYQLRQGDVPPWDLFIYGATDGMRGFFKTRQSKWLGALKNALHAVRMFKELKFREPQFVDVDLGLGAYIYWRSAITKEIKILPFFADRRKEGIDILLKTAETAKYVRDLAVGNLVFIYGNEDDFKNALAMADKLLKEYPENLILRYQKGRIFLWAKKYDDSLKMFADVYAVDPSIYKALLYQGLVLIRKKDFPSAEAALKKYLGVESEKTGRADANYYLGTIEESKGNKEGAIAYYKEAVSLGHLKAASARISALSH